jgi:nucleotide-binding universal stress UspA family protein
MSDQEFSSISPISAVQDFRDARRKAALQAVWASLTGQSLDLLPFEEVSKKLHAKGGARQKLKEIPLDAIVGSVGRYEDFNRFFLPKEGIKEERWTRVKLATETLEGVPPIEVYQIGDVYFVLDGNHRVSVARQSGANVIQAFVTPFTIKVPLTPEDDLDDVILKAEYTNFLEETHLDQLCPQLDFTATTPGRYERLLEHISVHRYYLGLEQNREINYEEAILSWVDHVYLPVIDVIRTRGILRDFPERTETDLYLWLLKHREELEEELGWDVKTEEAAADLAVRFSERPAAVAARVGDMIRDVVLPEDLDPGPPPGHWRAGEIFPRSDTCLFSSVLITISDTDHDWRALKQALRVAKKECGVVRGLYVLSEGIERDDIALQETQNIFDQLCAENEVQGRLGFASGSIARVVSKRAGWNDLVVLHLAHPPADDVLARLRSGLREIIHRSPRPVLAVPAISEMQRLLLAYDSSPKAKEALYLSAYIANSWGSKVFVLGSTDSKQVQKESLAEVDEYLRSQNVEAVFLDGIGQPGDVILEQARVHAIDLIVMGGYSLSPFMEVVLGSTVDRVLRGFELPVLICR